MKCVVLGLGKSGIAAISFLEEKDYDVYVYDDNEFKLSEYGDRFNFIKKPEMPEGSSLLVISPGVSRTHPLYIDALEKEIDIAGELEVAARYIEHAKVVAVTGTNGKSTTVTLAYEILKASGYKVFLCGNIGVPVLSENFDEYDFLVIELSSFQLETLKSLKVDTAAVLNITPDHLDRYDSFEEYGAVKLSLFDLVKKDGRFVIPSDKSLIPGFDTDAEKDVKRFSWNEKSDVLYEKGFIKTSLGDVKIKGTTLDVPHNIENFMAAFLLTEPFIKDIECLNSAVASFSALPHRTTFVDEINGVRFVDDSKATNVGAVEKSLAGFAPDSVILILGGVDKGGSYMPLASLIKEKCRMILLIGDAAPIIKKELDGIVPIFECGYDMRLCVNKGYELAEKGNTVLLSPACSSYDMYPNYGARGNDFCEKVKELR